MTWSLLDPGWDSINVKWSSQGCYEQASDEGSCDVITTTFAGSGGREVNYTTSNTTPVDFIENILYNK